MMQRPLDPGYAGGRGRAARPPACRRRPAHASVLLIVARGAHRSALRHRGARPADAGHGSAAAAKAQLIDQIEGRRAHGDRPVPPDHRPALGDQRRPGRRAAAARARAAWPTTCATSRLVTGAVRGRRGPGMRLTLDDAPAKDATKNAGRQPAQQRRARQGRVIARDLQIVVNGLWASGAEAISVNGQRLTSKAAIRFAGQAILVDYRPLTRALRHHRHRRPQGAARRVRRERRRQLPAVAEGPTSACAPASPRYVRADAHRARPRRSARRRAVAPTPAPPASGTPEPRHRRTHQPPTTTESPP